MTSNFVVRCALGLAAALTVGSAGAAAAQQTSAPRDTASRDVPAAGVPGDAGDSLSTRTARSSRRIRVSKDRGVSGASTTSGTSAGMRSSQTDTTSGATTPADTTTRADTTAVTPSPAAVAPSPTAADTSSIVAAAGAAGAESGTQPTMSRRFGSGFYVGLDAGGSVPRGDFDRWYRSGWSVGVPFGWQSLESPWGVRGDISYSRLSGRDFDVSNFGTGSTADPQIWSAQLDLKLNLPLSRTSTWRPALYALGGGGLHYFRNFTSDFNAVTGTGSGPAIQTALDGSSQTKFGLNGGLGLSFGIGRADLFVESRYVSVFTSGSNTNWVPVTFGITFF